MKWLIRFLLYVFGYHAKVRAIREVKRQGILAYLRAVQGTRRVLVLMVAAFLIAQLMLMSLVGALVTGFMLWDADFTLKMEVLFGLFTAFFFLPAIMLAVLLSGRLWYRASGAKRMMDDLQRAA